MTVNGKSVLPAKTEGDHKTKQGEIETTLLESSRQLLFVGDPEMETLHAVTQKWRLV